MPETKPSNSIAKKSEPAVTRNYPELPEISDESSAARPKVGLSDAQLNAIDMLLRGESFTAVAQQLGVTRKTVYNWRNMDAEFIAAYAQRRQEITDAAANYMRSLLHGSLKTLEKQSQDRYAPMSHRAAKTILSLSGVGKLVLHPDGKEQE